MSEPIVLDEEYADAEVYKDIVTKKHTHLYLVKVSLADIGMYMTGITVQPSPKQGEGELWVQPPRYQPVKGKWVKPIEFSRSSSMWGLIESLSVKAVQEFANNSKLDVVIIPTDEELDMFK